MIWTVSYQHVVLFYREPGNIVPLYLHPFDQDHSDFQLISKILCDKQVAVLISTLLAKPLHGQFYKYVQSGKVDVQRSFRWLKIHLHSETVSTVSGIQDQVIAKRVI